MNRPKLCGNCSFPQNFHTRSEITVFFVVCVTLFYCCPASAAVFQKVTHTAKNTVISRNFLVWKFCGKAQLPHSFRRFARKYAETVSFPQNFHTKKLGQITVFYAVAVQRVLFDFDLKKLFNKSPAFPPFVPRLLYITNCEF